jgi:large subunit ribosomal protein L3
METGMQGLIGRKIGMTRFFEKESGKNIAVTVVWTGSNIVHQVKTEGTDGYRAAQLGFDTVKPEKISKPEQGHFKKLGTEATRVVKEFGLESSDEGVKPGDRIGVEIFSNEKKIDVVGTSIGRGFAGTIKRYNFHRGRETHGNSRTRVGGRQYVSRSCVAGFKNGGTYGRDPHDYQECGDRGS